MSFVLRMGQVIVGRSELERAGPDAHERRGVFRPGLGFDLVEPVFALADDPADADRLARYARARDALRLTLWDAGGRELPTRAIDVRREGGGAALELVVRFGEE